VLAGWGFLGFEGGGTPRPEGDFCLAKRQSRVAKTPRSRQKQASLRPDKIPKEKSSVRLHMGSTHGAPGGETQKTGLLNVGRRGTMSLKKGKVKRKKEAVARQKAGVRQSQ